MERRDASAEASRTFLGGTIGAGARWAAALAVAGLVLTGCGAGDHAQTSEMGTAINGVDVNAGTLALRDLQVDFGETGSYLEGGTAPLQVWIANQGNETVILESVTSPAAEAVTLATEVAVAEPSESASATPGGEDSSPSAAASAGSEDAEVAAELVGEREYAIEIKPGSHVRLAPTTGSFLLLEGLKEDVSAAAAVEVEFTFSNGKVVTAELPMGVPAEAASRSYFGDASEAAAE